MKQLALNLKDLYSSIATLLVLSIAYRSKGQSRVICSNLLLKVVSLSILAFVKVSNIVEQLLKWF
jgi:hypothetical protein